jgi:hypothetical protein
MVDERWIDEFDELEPEKRAGNNPRKKRRSFDEQAMSKVQFLLLVGLGVLLIIIVGSLLLMGGRGSSTGDLASEVSSIKKRLSELEAEQGSLKKRMRELDSSEKFNRLFEGMQRLTREMVNLKQNMNSSYAHLQKEIEAVKKGRSAERQGSATSGSSQSGSSSGDGAVYHEVQKGENLYRISLEYDVDVKDIRNWNDLGKNEPIYPGQKLIVKPGSR